jgi:hypothetical protein
MAKLTPQAREMKDAIIEVARDLELHDDAMFEAVSDALRDIEDDIEIAADHEESRGDHLFHARQDSANVNGGPDNAS